METIDTETSFLLGIKPAIFSSTDSPHFHLLKSYPFIDKQTYPWLSKYDWVIFFQNEEMKQKVLEEYQGEKIQLYSTEYHHFLGEILGFPPKATAWFVIHHQIDELHKKYPQHMHYLDASLGERSKNIKMEYYGIVFATNYKDLEENAKWLWDQYQYSPESDLLKIKYHGTCISIQRYDYNAIKQITDSLQPLTQLYKSFSLMRYQVKKKSVFQYDSRAAEFFLLGMKPILVFPKNEYFNNKFPFIDATQFPVLGDDCMYFQTEEAKQKTLDEFISSNQEMKIDTPEYYRLLGKTLGYPPKTIEFYASGHHKKSFKKCVQIRYCGIQCLVNIDDLMEVIPWLWEEYPYSSADSISIFRDHTHITNIAFQDFKSLQKLQEQCQEYMKLKDQMEQFIFSYYKTD